MSNDEFVNIPVRKQYVEETYAFIGALAHKSANGGDTSELAGWTAEDLREIGNASQVSLQRITEVLDYLVAQPGEAVSLSQLAAAVGLTPSELRGALSALTRWMNNKFGSKYPHWPIRCGPRATNKPGQTSEFYYWVEPSVAKRWLSLR
jgi:hypothetical protein